MTMRIPPENRWQTIREIWNTNQWLYLFAGAVIGLFTYPLLEWLFRDALSFLQSLLPSIITVIGVVGLMEHLNRRRDTQNGIQNLQNALIRQAGSPVHSIAKDALYNLGKQRWLGRDRGTKEKSDIDSLIENANLRHANLHRLHLNHINFSGSDLFGINLRYASLFAAKLDNATLRMANMHNVNLREASLTHADLWYAKMFNADLGYADLRYSKLGGADLTDANLRYANLCGATLENAVFRTRLKGARIDETTIFDETTILPDGSFWSPDRDMAEFGAETRPRLANKFDGYDTYLRTFTDGTQRRFHHTKGWLDEPTSKRADLKGIFFTSADQFTYADLHDVNLEGADLRKVDLEGTNFTGANLRGVLIDETTRFTETTLLPDGTRWSPERNLASEFGLETRKIIKSEKSGTKYLIRTYTFADGTQRRWQNGKGWL